MQYASPPTTITLLLSFLCFQGTASSQPSLPDITFARESCSVQKLGASIPVKAIGEPVAGVTLSAPVWTAAKGTSTAYCSVDGSMAPVDKSPTAKPINFRVVLPQTWTHRAAQLGGGGMNGLIPNLSAQNFLGKGFATYGSDSGHQSGGSRGAGGRGPGAAPPAGDNDWSVNEESIRNFSYMQLKKTHDAAMVLIERAYGARPRYNYFVGTSQGGREALTVVQRYPADYDGAAANVPVLNFSALMLGPEWIRIQEKPIANWVTPAKVNAIRAEFMRQCDKLDGLADGIINNYQACRAIFDVKQGAAGRHPWTSKRCPNNVDPKPDDTSAAACLTDGQISTLQMVYSRYQFSEPVANGVTSFGMWVPNPDPSGSGLILPSRYQGQEGATENAPMHSALGILGVTGFLMGNVGANPLDYVEGGPLRARRRQLSDMMDATNPELSAFQQRGGKLLVTIGTGDTLASPGAQLDYYQSVIDKMTQAKVDTFARFWVLPQANHGLGGTNYSLDGDGKTIATAPIPNTYDRVALLMDWVENNKAPGKSITVTAGEKSLPMCSYPAYPKYTGGPANASGSYTCALP